MASILFRYTFLDRSLPFLKEGFFRFLRLSLFPSILILVLSLLGCFPSDKVEQSPEEVSSSFSLLSDPRMLTGKKILVVHSYHKEYAWVAGITRGITKTFGGTKADVQILYMDTKRRSDEEWKRAAGRKAWIVVQDWDPDIVIAVDDNAQRYFVAAFSGMKKIPVVFCGVNASPETYGYPTPNVTGILERPYFIETIEYLKKILPEAKKIAVVTDDSPTSAGALAYMKKQKLSPPIVAWETPTTFGDWQKSIRRIQGEADAIAVYMYHTIGKRNHKKNLSSREVMAWTVEESRIPIIGFFDFSIDDGALCGVVESGTEHGYEASQIAREILLGKSPVDFPFKVAKGSRTALNIKTAKKLHLNILDKYLQSTDIVVGYYLQDF